MTPPHSTPRGGEGEGKQFDRQPCSKLKQLPPRQNPLARVTSVILTRGVTDTPPTPARRFASILNRLVMTVDSRAHTGQLARPLVALIVHRLILMRQAIARAIARIAAGKIAPRKSGGPRPGRRPGTPNRLPTSPAWLIKLVPETAAAAWQLRSLLADPEIAALLAAAPGQMSRPLRSLCRMLDVEPPLPPPPRPARPKPQAAPRKPRAPASPRPGRPRYVFGLRYPPPLPDPA